MDKAPTKKQKRLTYDEHMPDLPNRRRPRRKLDRGVSLDRMHQLRSLPGLAKPAFRVEGTASRGKHRRELLAYLIRRRARSDEWSPVPSELIEQIARDAVAFPNAIEQVDNLLLWLAQNTEPGNRADVRYRSFQAIIGTATKTGFALITGCE